MRSALLLRIQRFCVVYGVLLAVQLFFVMYSAFLLTVQLFSDVRDALLAVQFFSVLYSTLLLTVQLCRPQHLAVSSATVFCHVQHFGS